MLSHFKKADPIVSAVGVVSTLLLPLKLIEESIRILVATTALR